MVNNNFEVTSNIKGKIKNLEERIRFLEYYFHLDSESITKAIDEKGDLPEDEEEEYTPIKDILNTNI